MSSLFISADLSKLSPMVKATWLIPINTAWGFPKDVGKASHTQINWIKYTVSFGYKPGRRKALIYLMILSADS